LIEKVEFAKAIGVETNLAAENVAFHRTLPHVRE
jgi:hypothetical protein